MNFYLNFIEINYLIFLILNFKFIFKLLIFIFFYRFRILNFFLNFKFFFLI